MKKTTCPLTVTQRFLANQSGNVVVMFAIAAVPLFAVGGIALDYTRAWNAQSVLQQSTDAAALAAATHDSDDAAVKKVEGRNFFDANNTVENAATEVTVTGKDVTVTATATVPTTLSRLLAIDSVTISTTATATWAPSPPVCMLALNPAKAGTINLWGSGANLTADGCAVHANSTHDQALKNSAGSTSHADSFCTGGRYSGAPLAFNPKPRENCRKVKDPYAGLPVPNVSGCDFTNEKLSNGSRTFTPGVYCKGFSITGGTATFLPGLYVIKDGPFNVNGGTIIANEVTFYLYGNNASLDLTGGSLASTITAAKSGPYAGLVFVQHPNADPGGYNKINGSSGLKIIGVSYFPNHKLRFGGNGSFGVSSPLMAFVADEYEMHGNGQIRLSVDFAAAGYPSTILPKEFNGVRLMN